MLRWPFASVDEFKAKPALSGIPFLGPWANRLDEQAFYANGTAVPVRHGARQRPRRAFRSTASSRPTDQWQVVEAKADATIGVGDEPARVLPAADWMKQLPFAHTIEMTLPAAGRRARSAPRASRNLSAEPMPVAIGFHPYFQLTDSPRDEWTHFGRRAHALAARAEQDSDRRDRADRAAVSRPARPSRCATTISTTCSAISCATPSGAPTMSVAGKSQRLDVVLGPNYRAAVVWAPTAPATSSASSRWPASPTRMNLAQQGPLQGAAAAFRRAAPGRRASGFARADSDAPFRLAAHVDTQSARSSQRKRFLRSSRPLRSSAAFVAAPALRAQDESRALTIVGGDLADGSGAPLRRANVRFVNDRIVAVGDVKPQRRRHRRRRQGAGRRAGLHRHPQSFGRAGWRTIPPPRRRSRRASPPSSSAPTAIRRGRLATTWPSGGSDPAAVNVAVIVGHATVRRLVMNDDYKRAGARRRNRADGAARRSGDARGRGRPVERPRVRSRRLRGDAASWSSSRRSSARYGGIYMSHIRDEADKSFDALQRSDRDRRAARMSRCRSRTSSSAPSASGARRRTPIALIEAARAARRRRDRRRVSLQRVELDDHRARAGQALRLPAERRARRSPTSAARRTC